MENNFKTLPKNVQRVGNSYSSKSRLGVVKPSKPKVIYKTEDSSPVEPKVTRTNTANESSSSSVRKLGDVFGGMIGDTIKALRGEKASGTNGKTRKQMLDEI